MATAAYDSDPSSASLPIGEVQEVSALRLVESDREAVAQDVEAHARMLGHFSLLDSERPDSPNSSWEAIEDVDEKWLGNTIATIIRDDMEGNVGFNAEDETYELPTASDFDAVFELLNWFGRDRGYQLRLYSADPKKQIFYIREPELHKLLRVDSQASPAQENALRRLNKEGLYELLDYVIGQRNTDRELDPWHPGNY